MVALASPASHSAPRRALRPQDKRPGQRSLKNIHLSLSSSTAGHERHRRRLWRAHCPRVGPEDGLWPRRRSRAPSGSPAGGSSVRAPVQAAGPTLRRVCGRDGRQKSLWGLRAGEENEPIQHELMSPRARVAAPPHEGWRAPTRALRTTETAAAPTTARAPAAATASPYPDHHHAFGPTPVTRGMPPRGGCGRCRKHSPTVNVVAIPQRTPRSGRNRSLDLMGGRGRRVAASLRR